MNGYKTVIANAVLLVASVLTLIGVDIGIEEQAAIVTSVVTVGNIVLRFATTGPIFEK